MSHLEFLEEALKDNNKRWSDIMWAGNLDYWLDIEDFKMTLANLDSKDIERSIFIVGTDWWLRYEIDDLYGIRIDQWTFYTKPERPLLKFVDIDNFLNDGLK